ncbi:RidA family protein [Acrocarpospora macrocephala]|uniref:LysR family transcriptional regulator n=1 Tax=Acrocarpospora macrocephala TaxID=150177 RepID=A0A5M3WGP5_9ACTN|nr:RidA family protein [Acrocarpospora macrocephala]GES08297.1 LysR family transcriptional regulator [Acrocarpospora macrocephala]
MTPEERLARLGLVLPEVVTPLAAYVPAVRTGNYVYTSGQLPIVDGKLIATGKLGAEVSDEQGIDLARICALNAMAAIISVAGDLSHIVRIVKVLAFVASTPEYTNQPVVVDGASTLFGEVLGEAGRHARSAVGVAVLPRNAPVELEVVAEVR